MSCSSCPFCLFGRGAGDSMELYHQMVLSALMKTNTRSSRVECFDLLVMGLNTADMLSSTCVCMQDLAVSHSIWKAPLVGTTGFLAMWSSTELVCAKEIMHVTDKYCALSGWHSSLDVLLQAFTSMYSRSPFGPCIPSF